MNELGNRFPNTIESCKVNIDGKDDLKDLNKMLKTVKVSNKNNSYDSGDDEFISFFDIN